VSTFKLRERDMQLVSVVSSGGVHPISVTEHDDLVYVLNDGAAGNVAGFRNERGTLKPIGGSVRGLSASTGTLPAQVGFSDDGEALVVTEKGTSKLTSYRVRDNGSIATPIVTPSPGLTPFGFAFNRRNQLLVTEAVASGVSSYRFRDADPARPVVVSASVLDTQAAACWIAITPNGRYAYVANAGTSTVSSYRIATGGQIELLSAVAGAMPAGSGPTDTAVSSNGRNLYVLDGRTFSIAAFAVGGDGTLAEQTVVTGLPLHVVGLAAN
jgi:6-phosphogluconolactonase (cycloisomerase 2 family)